LGPLGQQLLLIFGRMTEDRAEVKTRKRERGEDKKERDWIEE